MNTNEAIYQYATFVLKNKNEVIDLINSQGLSSLTYSSPIDEVNKKIDEIYIKDENYWLIPLNYLEKNVYSINCDYNVFCEFIKWRDKSILISKLLLNYKDKKFNECIVKSMLSYIYNNEISKREILDTCIDNMSIFIEYVDNNDIEKMLKIKNIEKSTKFKLIEMHEKK